VTTDELQRLAPAQIVILGSAGAVSSAVEAELRRLAPTVVRVAGADRYATAAAVAQRYFATARSAWLATGQAFPDALAATPVAGITDAPLLLTLTSSLPASTAAQLRRLGPAQVFVAGSGAAVSEQVVSAVRTTLNP
jgi:putative cell wall-binding protein